MPLPKHFVLSSGVSCDIGPGITYVVVRKAATLCYAFSNIGTETHLFSASDNEPPSGVGSGCVMVFLSGRVLRVAYMTAPEWIAGAKSTAPIVDLAAKFAIAWAVAERLDFASVRIDGRFGGDEDVMVRAVGDATRRVATRSAAPGLVVDLV